MRLLARRLRVLFTIGVIATSCATEVPTSMQLGDRDEWVAGFDDRAFGECLYDAFVEQVSPADMAIHMEYLDDPPTTTPQSVVAARSQCVHEVGLDYSDDFEDRFVPSCESSGMPQAYCECVASQLRMTVPYPEFYDEQERTLRSPGYLSPTLAAAAEPCGSGEPSGFASDAEFVAAADAICADTAEYLDETTSPDPAENVRIATRAFTDLVAALRDLPVADEVRPQVEAWLVLFEGYIRIGERYADALESGAPQEELTAIGNEGDLPAAALRAIAEDNGMPSCAF